MYIQSAVAPLLTRIERHTVLVVAVEGLPRIWSIFRSCNALKTALR